MVPIAQTFQEQQESAAEASLSGPDYFGAGTEKVEKTWIREVTSARFVKFMVRTGLESKSWARESGVGFRRIVPLVGQPVSFVAQNLIFCPLASQKITSVATAMQVIFRLASDQNIFVFS
jgi:hypothetical protein